MPLEGNLHNGLGITRGDQFTLTRRIQAVPIGRTIQRAWLTIKANLTDSDASAIFQKEITTTHTAGQGQIADDPVASLNRTTELRFEITSSDTMAMTADQVYYYDIQIRLDSGDIYTIESGRTSAREQVTIDAT